MALFSKQYNQKPDPQSNESSAPTRSFDFEKNKKAAFWLAEFWNPKLKGIFRWRDDLEVIQPKEDKVYIVYDDKNKARNMYVFWINYDMSHDAFKRSCSTELERAGVFKK